MSLPFISTISLPQLSLTYFKQVDEELVLEAQKLQPLAKMVEFGQLEHQVLWPVQLPFT